MLLLKGPGCLTLVSKFSHLAHCLLGLCCDSAIIYLLFSRLAVGGDHGSFAFAVHLGGCSGTFNFIPLDTCQRKLPGKPTISIATRLVLSPCLYPALSSLRFPSFSFFFYIPNIAHKSGRVSAGGSLKPSTGGAFFPFFFSIAVPGCSSLPPVVRWWGLLKATASRFLSTSLKFKLSSRGPSSFCLTSLVGVQYRPPCTDCCYYFKDFYLTFNVPCTCIVYEECFNFCLMSH